MAVTRRHALAAATLCALFFILPIRASQADALAITANIEARHIPFGTVVDPVFASPTSNQITGYTRCGDSALWTGHYLAAEAFRYKVTGAADALANVKQALAGLKALLDVTGTNVLARCLVVASSPYAAGIQSEEAANGIYMNGPYFWVGNTSRDQYLGVAFGAAVAYDMVNDAGVQSSINDLVTRLVGFLTGNNWSIVMPNGTTVTTFVIRPDEMLTLLEIGKHINPGKFSTDYNVEKSLLSATVSLPIQVDTADDSSYFKFNLDSIDFYNLLRLDNSGDYASAYSILRNHTAPQQNAFFDIIDRAINGPNSTRDAEMVSLLDEWLLRPRRDPYVDLSKTVAVCGSQACAPVPVPLRPPADFIWQVSPYQLTGGESGLIEGAGIDYILPYWMARYYSVISDVAVQSAAAASVAVAPDSIASIYGSNLGGPATPVEAASTPLPTNLGGVTVTVTDAAGAQRQAPLIYVSQIQINFVIPDGTATGHATFTISNGSSTAVGTTNVLSVAPTLFSMSGTGSGVAAATAVATNAGNPQLQSPVPVFSCTGSTCTSVPIQLGVDTPVYLTLYATGVRNASSPSNVQVTINGISVPVSYAGAQPTFAGLDQVNVGLPLNLRGSGESPVVLTVDGQTSNTVTVNIQ